MEIILAFKDQERVALGKLWSKGIQEIDYPKISTGITGYQFEDTPEVREVLEECGLVIDNLYYHFRKRGYYVSIDNN